MIVCGLDGIVAGAIDTGLDLWEGPSVVGRDVGCVVGHLVGDSEGEIVGCSTGCPVGVSVGLVVVGASETIFVVESEGDGISVGGGRLRTWKGTLKFAWEGSRKNGWTSCRGHISDHEWYPFTIADVTLTDEDQSHSFQIEFESPR